MNRSNGNLRDDIKATRDDIQVHAEQLREVEAKKARLSPRDPSMKRLSRVGIQLAERILDATKVEAALVEEATPKGSG
jgi:hypothetical protein